MNRSDAFFTVHRDLPREGPGTASDVRWALDVAGIGGNVRMFDAGCGPGADTVSLAEARPKARILGIDKQAHFIDAARKAAAKLGDRVEFRQGDYREIDGTFDFIWCAGAAYFVGFTELLGLWRPHLAEGGAIAFSEPVFLSNDPPAIVRDFWAGEGEIRTQAFHERQLDEAGWQVIGTRVIVGAAWDAYYTPLKARVEMLLETATDPVLIAVLNETAKEYEFWQQAPDDIAYCLYVVRSE